MSHHSEQADRNKTEDVMQRYAEGEELKIRDSCISLTASVL